MRALALAVVAVASASFAAERDVSARLSAMRAQLPKLDAARRGPLTPALKPGFVALGAAAVPELVEAFAAPRAAGLTDSAHLAWQASLLEALGTFGDARARPLFERVLADESQPALVQRAAAEALGRFGDDAAVKTLTGLVKRDEAVAGMGSCRRVAMARVLAAELALRPGAERARALIRALSDIGNVWAWKTLAAREEEVSTREIAARALVRAFVDYDGDLRQWASNGVMVVGSAATPRLIAEAGSGAELRTLADRFAKNPVR